MRRPARVQVPQEILGRLYRMNPRQWQAARAMPTTYTYVYVLRIFCRIPEHGGICRGVLPVLVSVN